MCEDCANFKNCVIMKTRQRKIYNKVRASKRIQEAQRKALNRQINDISRLIITSEPNVNSHRNDRELYTAQKKALTLDNNILRLEPNRNTNLNSFVKKARKIFSKMIDVIETQHPNQNSV